MLVLPHIGLLILIVDEVSTNYLPGSYAVILPGTYINEPCSLSG